jgi:putative endopeptidase
VKYLLFAATLTCASAFGQTGFSPAAMDKSVNPCNDFYQYACGSWMKANPVPSDQSRWGRFNELQERNITTLKDILETSSAKSTRTPVEQKIGDYYAACLDEKGIEQKGTAPLKPYLDQIAAIDSRDALAAALGRLHKVRVDGFFSVGAGPDFKNSKLVIAHVGEGGLSLPDRDYYLNTDAKSVELRDKYVAHVTNMFKLLGYPEDKAAASAKVVLRIETELAKPAMDRVARRNPLNRYHPMSGEEFARLTPSFRWEAYADTLGAPHTERINVTNPEFYRSLEKTLTSTSPEDMRTYLTWHLLRVAAPTLPRAFVQEDFAFFGQVLTGAKELKPRWKRCVEAVDTDLPEALGQKYVEVAFGSQAKQRMTVLIANITKALEKDIKTIDWMTPDTKKRALEKLHAIWNKVGYPEKWISYATLDIKPGDALGNSLRSNAFEYSRRLSQIGKAPDPTEWRMSPPTVNAYYSPLENNINFPAGILQPPFFDVKMDDAVNYGGIGAVIGHEITHGFDDQGRRFDAEGNLKDWWTPEDGKEYEKRAACIADQYSQYAAVGDVKLNGKLTLGENVADNGGLRLAYMALQEALQGKPQEKIDGFTPEQRLFLGFAQVWCQNITDEAARLRAQTDPHSPGRYRTNGTVSNMPEFWKAFGCREGQPMVRGANACRVW